MRYNYPPLDIALEDLEAHQELSFTGDEFLNYSDDAFGTPPDMTFDEFVNYALSCKIFDKDTKDERFRKCNKTMKFTVNMVKNSLNFYKPEEIRSEALDIALMFPIIRKWYQCKQVYKLDADFANALLKTNKAKISKDAILHLPTNIFYVDISDLKYAQIHGIFVYISYDLDSTLVFITMYIITKDDVLYSRYNALDFFDGDEFVINYDTDLPYHTVARTREAEGDHLYYKKDIPEQFSFAMLTTLVYQLLIYMGVSEKDMAESPITKSTYRPRKPDSPIKNKFSELQIFDVGLRYGNEFRRKIKELNINKDELEIISESDEEDIDTEIEPGKESHRKAPRPHLRSAHWTHRWCGHKGDQHLELRWIEPVFVGFGKDAILNQATLHAVNGD